MKIRTVELTNLRRFAGRRARIDGIGDGVTILSEPNEFGKSTFFDALHALFFERHRSTRAPVKSLQPHSGGAPEVAVEIELPNGLFRLEKRWLSRATARVLDGTGRLIAQDDEAEAWMDALMGQGLAGPSGLLWVRQGLLGLEPQGASAAERNERERGLVARRDLMSSVAGEIELMTGGRRMDLVLARTNEALGRLATATQKPKAGGEWARAVDDAAALAAQSAELDTKAARLTEDLRHRAELQRQITTLSDPETRATTEADLAEAQRRFDAAEAHAAQIREAQSTLRLAQLTVSQGATAIERQEELAARLADADKDLRRAQDDLSQADLLLARAKAFDTEVAGQHAAQSERARDLALRLEATGRARLALAAREKMANLGKRLARAEALRNQIETQTAGRARIRVTPASMAALDKAEAARDRISAQIEAQLVSVSFAYEGALRATMGGQVIDATPLRLRASTRFELPGIGVLSVDPGAATAEDARAELDRAQKAVSDALTACGATDPAQARHALAEGLRLDTAVQNAQSLLREIAPDGFEVLRAALARAQGEASEDPGEAVDDIGSLETALALAREGEAKAQAARHEAQTRLMAVGERRAAAQATAEGAARRLGAAQTEAGDTAVLAAGLVQLRALQLGLAQAETAARTALDLLQQAAPDLETAAAALKRMASIQIQRQTDLARLTRDLAGVNGSIGALADEGIEELLDETRGREAAALARADRYAREVKALSRLRSALEDARRAAHEAYFGPVLRELEPLLSILHPGASLLIDDESLLPVALMRDGQSETLDILSGGTREQIAILTRLAFARLFSRGGQPVPVILDDALVHSDDDRIEAMFTALHRVALDQQIIVLTCRQRAFASLGGDRVRARIEPA